MADDKREPVPAVDWSSLSVGDVWVLTPEQLGLPPAAEPPAVWYRVRVTGPDTFTMETCPPPGSKEQP